MGSKRIQIPPLTTKGKMGVTKLEAAIRQLETAIRLWFFDGDPVSICTLVHAALDIYKGLLDHSGLGKNPMEQAEEDMVRPEMLEVYRAIMRADQNFCKHAGKDPDKVHHLAVKNYPLKMLECVGMHQKLGYGKRGLFELIYLWVLLTEPHLFKKPATSIFNQGFDIDGVIKAGKQKFFYDFLPVFERQLSGVPIRHSGSN